MPQPTATQPPADPRAPIRRRSVWPVIVAALALSLPLHLLLALWLASVRVERPERVQQAVLVETVAPTPGEDAGDGPPPAAPVPMPAMPMDAVTNPAIDPSAIASVPDAEAFAASNPQGAFDAAASAPALAPGPAVVAASGSGGGGMAATTFFGARASGKRFAFIVDKSGSMQAQDKMKQAVSELMRSVRALPDFAQFRVCFFDTSNTLFPDRGFRKARAADIEQFGAWIGGVRPYGGTTPMHAFEQVMTDATPPDAIFFMTDGLIPAEDPAAIIKLVTVRGGAIPVHCVAFGDPEAARQLQMIAEATGGQYRFVPLEGVR